MSLPEQEANSLEMAKDFLYSLSSGAYKIESITKLREDARRIAKHYPLSAGRRWLNGGGNGNR